MRTPLRSRPVSVDELAERYAARSVLLMIDACTTARGLAARLASPGLPPTRPFPGQMVW